MDEKGRKDDFDKPPMQLLSSIALEGTAKVLAHGAKRYGAHNWRAGLSWSRILGAILRHTVAIIGGEDNDPDSGLPHIDHVATEVMFLQEFWRTRRDLDDRYKFEADKK